MDSKTVCSPLVAETSKRLLAAEVVFCHWKSNDKILLSETGENDLDLLIKREDIHKFKMVLFDLGYKSARFRKGPRSRPGVEDYYGYDLITDRIIHVHAHYQLVTGNDATKSFRLPVENALIKSSSYAHSKLFLTPRAEFELVVFVVRMILKWTLLGAIKKRGRVLSVAYVGEFEFLHKQCDMEEIKRILMVHFEQIPVPLFMRFLSVLASNRANIVTQYLIYGSFRRCLQPYAMNSRFLDAVLVNYRRTYSIISKYVVFPKKNRRLPTGGIQVAIVGGDGAGKTTAVNEICSWLSNDFEVQRLHLGKPKRSLSTLCFDVFLKISGIRKKFPLDSSVNKFPGYFWMMRMVLYARDRYRCARKGALSASKGIFVIYDRYPMKELTTMDTLCCGLAIKYNSSKPARFLEKVEKKYFSKICAADYMIFLKVDPSIAVSRNTDDEPEYVRIRNEEISSLKWVHEMCEVVDANKNQDHVLKLLKQYLWKIL